MIHISEMPAFTPRKSDGHKGEYGKILIIAGSRGMSGAAVLCGRAALRGGAGLVRLAVPEAILEVVANGDPCYTTSPLPCDQKGRITMAALPVLLSQLDDNHVLAIGPGLSQSTDLTSLLTELLPQIPHPTVIDADGLNALADRPDIWKKCTAPVIITPHPGEFARLTNQTISTIQQDRIGWATRFALEHNLIVLLKGSETIVTDGSRLYRNATGNPGMATGGCGDVLTGLLAALLGQKFPPFEAAHLGAYLHGKAGDLARDAVGEVSLTAIDVIQQLPNAIRTA